MRFLHGYLALKCRQPLSPSACISKLLSKTNFRGCDHDVAQKSSRLAVNGFLPTKSAESRSRDGLNAPAGFRGASGHMSSLVFAPSVANRLTAGDMNSVTELSSGDSMDVGEMDGTAVLRRSWN